MGSAVGDKYSGLRYGVVIFNPVIHIYEETIATTFGLLCVYLTLY